MILDFSVFFFSMFQVFLLLITYCKYVHVYFFFYRKSYISNNKFSVRIDLLKLFCL